MNAGSKEKTYLTRVSLLLLPLKIRTANTAWRSAGSLLLNEQHEILTSSTCISSKLFSGVLADMTGRGTRESIPIGSTHESLYQSERKYHSAYDSILCMTVEFPLKTGR